VEGPWRGLIPHPPLWSVEAHHVEGRPPYVEKPEFRKQFTARKSCCIYSATHGTPSLACAHAPTRVQAAAYFLHSHGSPLTLAFAREIAQ
jgi:hypothetical protein